MTFICRLRTYLPVLLGSGATPQHVACVAGPAFPYRVSLLHLAAGSPPRLRYRPAMSVPMQREGALTRARAKVQSTYGA